jgi:hypothetical protein
MMCASLDSAPLARVLSTAPRVALVTLVLVLLSACGVVDATGSVVGGAVDLTVDAVDTTTDVVTAPL